MSDGIEVAAGRVILDLDVLRRLHEVGDGEDDYDCPVCGENYPCELRELVDQLQDWLDARSVRAPVPDGAGGVSEGVSSC